MCLTNRDIKWAIDSGKLIVEPRPEELSPPKGYDETSIDLHLGPLDVARVWNLDGLRREDKTRGTVQGGHPPEVGIGSFDWDGMVESHLKAVPEGDADGRLVFRRGHEIVVRRFGFVLWTTKEKVGTPKIDPAIVGHQRQPELICFVNAKSTMARTGLIVHFTAPTIHAGWAGNVTLEISNLGPFTFVLRESDALAQLTVATISSPPDLKLKVSKSKTQGQNDPSGSPRPASQKP